MQIDVAKFVASIAPWIATVGGLFTIYNVIRAGWWRRKDEQAKQEHTKRPSKPWVVRVFAYVSDAGRWVQDKWLRLRTPLSNLQILQSSLTAANAQTGELETKLATANVEIAALKKALDEAVQHKARPSEEPSSRKGAATFATRAERSGASSGSEARLRILGDQFGYHLQNIGRGDARDVYIYAATSPYSRIGYDHGPRSWPLIAAGQKELLFRSAPSLGGPSQYTVEWDDDTARKRTEQVTATAGQGLF